MTPTVDDRPFVHDPSRSFEFNALEELAWLRQQIKMKDVQIASLLTRVRVSERREHHLSEVRNRYRDLFIKKETQDIEQVSAAVHDAWMVEQRKLGRTSSVSRQTGEEFMVPYAELSEAAKDFDRATVRAVMAALYRLDAPPKE